MKKILIIDDDATLVELLQMVLEFKGYRTDTAVCGEEGMRRIVSFEPDVILCDVLIPDPDGHEILRWLRQEEHLAHLPFIFLTALSERTDVRSGMNHGADDYLCKPVGLDDILAAIDTRINRQAAMKHGAAPRPSEIVFDSFEPLLELGLTRREAEVLNWVAQGKSNPEIAVILGISPRTVGKHVEHILGTLEVESRGTAALVALEAHRKVQAVP